jgi:MtN3 and saliva related transmembrane protein
MDWIKILGIAAAILTTAANIPQAIKMIRTRSTKSISAATYALLLTGLLLWLAYGIIRKDLPIILANAVSAVLAAIILFMKLTNKKKEDPS